MVQIDYGDDSVVLGEPESQMTKGEYTLGLDSTESSIVDPDDLGDERSHGGWSLIII